MEERFFSGFVIGPADGNGHFTGKEKLPFSHPLYLLNIDNIAVMALQKALIQLVLNVLKASVKGIVPAIRVNVDFSFFLFQIEDSA